MKSYFTVSALTAIACCVFLFSCKEKKADNVQHKVISNYTEIEECYDSVYFKSSIAIRLETTDECLIKEIDKIMFDENRLFIFDKSLNSVFVFDMDGKFLHAVNRTGNGPGEYTDLSSVCLDVEKKQLILVPFTPLKIYYLDYDGNLLREADRAKIWYKEINCQDNNIYATILPRQGNDSCYIYAIDNDGKERCFVEYPEVYQNTYFFDRYYMTKTKNLNFTINCENFIYEIVDDKVIKKYEIDFGKYNLPRYYVRKDIPLDEFLDAMKREYIYSIVEVVDGDNYLAFTTNRLIPAYIYSKTEDLLTRIFKIRDSKYAFSCNQMYHIENMPNSIAFIKDAASLLDLKDATKFWENEKWAKQKQNLWNLTETMQFDDNPVVMIYNFR
ncbi:MAG: 6-bladed beta-propeller [Prevotellaceae bacterium]|jgi:hypothetical protein|nr:6-bladed beta-propeller [Prevotellaceae bacterium]